MTPNPTTTTSGLFVVWPVALLGLLLVRWGRDMQVVPILGATIGLFGVFVLSTE